MSIVKSFSVGNGDMFYIKHNSNNFTIIDCCYDTKSKWEVVLDEIKRESYFKRTRRFISTHPDDDHIRGLTEFERALGINNFYCVENKVTKSDVTDDFCTYLRLRDNKKCFHLYKGLKNLWMNQMCSENDNPGIKCLWPDINNVDFLTALKEANSGKSPNNISPIITYSTHGATFMWMGDLEHDFLEKIKEHVDWPHVDILFAPHHGRESGRVPIDVLSRINPKIIVLGEAPSENLHYDYKKYGFNTITQNSAGDITFECSARKVIVYVVSQSYSVDFLGSIKGIYTNRILGHPIGRLNI